MNKAREKKGEEADMERKTWETMGRGAKMQPLGEAEQELLRRGYELFERFRIGLTEAHDEMRRARMIRQLR